MNILQPKSLDSILSRLTSISDDLATFATTKANEAIIARSTINELEAQAHDATAAAERAERVRERIAELVS